MALKRLHPFKIVWELSGSPPSMRLIWVQVGAIYRRPSNLEQLEEANGYVGGTS